MIKIKVQTHRYKVFKSTWSYKVLNRVPIPLIALLPLIMSTELNATPIYPHLELQGHRGARGLAPENTIPAFELALQHRMTTLELDTALTADNLLIVHHDTVTNPKLCQNINGHRITPRRILELKQIDIQSLDCGSLKHQRFPDQLRQVTHPPTLSDVIQLEKRYNVTPLYNIEIKTDRHHTPQDKTLAVKALSEELSSLRVSHSRLMERVTIQSFDAAILRAAARLLPEVRRSALIEPKIDPSATPPKVLPALPKALITYAETCQATVISPYHETVTSNLIKAAHAHNLKVIPWTVNDTKRMLELINMGVDGVISDYPNRLRSLVDQRPKTACRTKHVDSDCQHPISDRAQSGP